MGRGAACSLPSGSSATPAAACGSHSRVSVPLQYSVNAGPQCMWRLMVICVTETKKLPLSYHVFSLLQDAAV